MEKSFHAQNNYRTQENSTPQLQDQQRMFGTDVTIRTNSKCSRDENTKVYELTDKKGNSTEYMYPEEGCSSTTKEDIPINHTRDR